MRWNVLWAALLTGCASAVEVEATLETEGDAVRRVFEGTGWFTTAFVVGVAIGFSLLVRLGLQVIKRGGWDDPRRLDAIRMVADVLALAWTALMLLRLGFKIAPQTTLVFVIIAGGGLLVWSGRWVQGLGASVALVVRGELRTGDHLRTEGAEGIIERVGLLRVRLRTADGGRALVPTAQLAGSRMELSSPQRSTPVVVRLRGERPWSAAQVQRARRVASLCPYRDLRSDVHVGLEDEDRTISVRIGAWSSTAAGEGARWLRGALVEPVVGASEEGRVGG